MINETEKIFLPVIKNMSLVFICVIFVLPVFAQQTVNDGYGDYVLVPAGEFQMGDNFSEGESNEMLSIPAVYNTFGHRVF